MPWGAVAAVGAVASGYMQSEAIKDASAASAGAADQAALLEQQRYEQTREDMAPWREAGTRALGGMQDLMYGNPEEQMDQLRSTPGYQFRLDEGLKALTRSSLAGSVSGNTHRGLMEYGQDYASNEFGNRYNRLAGLAGTGQTATQYTGDLGARSAERQGAYGMDAANIRGAGQIGVANVYGNTLGSLASAGKSFMGSNQSPQPMGGNFSTAGYVPPGGSFGGPDPYAGAGGYGDNWVDY